MPQLTERQDLELRLLRETIEEMGRMRHVARLICSPETHRALNAALLAAHVDVCERDGRLHYMGIPISVAEGTDNVYLIAFSDEEG